MESIITDLINCARCGKSHLKIEFKPFTILSPKYSHWANCPEVNEPILLWIKQPTFLEMTGFRFFQIIHYIKETVYYMKLGRWFARGIRECPQPKEKEKQ
jgi:hypothetical protein